MGNDYKTIDKTPDPGKDEREKKLKKRLKITVMFMILLPPIYFIIVNFILNMQVPEQMYAILGLLYVAIFTIVIIMSILIPHT